MHYQMNLKMKQLIIQKSEEIFEKIKGYREYIHANPELSYEEHETMAFISEKLDELGIEHEAGIGKTGGSCNNSWGSSHKRRSCHWITCRHGCFTYN